MTTPDPTTPDPTTSETNRLPISKLRAGGTDVDGRKVARVAGLVILVTLAVLSVVFFVGGAHKNSQIDSLRHHGVTVDATITGCEGLLGGSGSNSAGYICKGTFTLGGHRYHETLPGSSFERPGTIVHEVSLPSDPGLLETPSQVASQHVSDNVYILPTILAAAFVVLLAAAGLHLRRRRA
jgi:hypothetical protein